MSSGASDIPQEEESGKGEEIPRSPRASVLLGAEIKGFGAAPPTKHRIRDLSATGVRVDGAAGLRPGSTVLVSVGMLEAVGATVIWVRDAMAGLKFAEPIDPNAARAKAIVAPTDAAGKPTDPARKAAPGVAAGWVTRLQNPYD